MAKVTCRRRLWGEHLIDVEIDLTDCSVLHSSFTRCRITCNGENGSILRGSNCYAYCEFVGDSWPQNWRELSVVVVGELGPLPAHEFREDEPCTTQQP